MIEDDLDVVSNFIILLRMTRAKQRYVPNTTSINVLKALRE